MRKLSFIILFAITVPGLLNACDYCNCYLGLNPHYKKNNIGLRYHYSYFRGTHEDDNVLQETGQTKDDFWETRSMLELHGQWYPVQKLQVLVSLPYIYNREFSNPPPVTIENGGNMHQVEETNKGIGDPVLIAHYQLFNKISDDSTSDFSQRLFAGGGIKIPLGHWHLESGADPIERIHLPGTGAMGYLASMLYIASFNRTGFNFNASYLITTANNEGFRFGNTFNANMLFYYTSHINKFSFYPDAGLYLEQAAKDKDYTSEIHNSGGTVLYGHLGADFYYRKLSLTLAAQMPLMQSLNENQPHVKVRIVTGVGFAF